MSSLWWNLEHLDHPRRGSSYKWPLSPICLRIPGQVRYRVSPFGSLARDCLPYVRIFTALGVFFAKIFLLKLALSHIPSDPLTCYLSQLFDPSLEKQPALLWVLTFMKASRNPTRSTGHDEGNKPSVDFSARHSLIKPGPQGF